MERSVYTPACPRRPALGTFDGVGYDQASVTLAGGDLVVFYTDGLVEARRGREEYGAERLLRGLEAHAGRPAPDLGEKLLLDLEGFLGDDSPIDDVTLIVAKVV
jgi:serine phosphatase RsbU (regulator of sigma subunit)